MDVEIRQLGSRGVELRVFGRLDVETVGELRPALLDYPSPKVLLNLSDVESIDAAGMALVMMARIELEATGIRFVVECSEPKLTGVLMAAGLPDSSRSPRAGSMPCARWARSSSPRPSAASWAWTAPSPAAPERKKTALPRTDLAARGLQRGENPLRHGGAREPGLLAQERRLAVRDVAVRDADADDPPAL